MSLSEKDRVTRFAKLLEDGGIDSLTDFQNFETIKVEASKQDILEDTCVFLRCSVKLTHPEMSCRIKLTKNNADRILSKGQEQSLERRRPPPVLISARL
ncbi:hypothetical protein E1301_Tti015308 [Triplophysa tibetana]|uniref:Uncharacterized protein n=1 Tax=Triplophysa tibetana TaxID=1572043 RepID=A0A5A9PSD5_9TELE|nr:hypothetical protein E1301_Tti015308 [Triplophysa tibetana]